MIIDGFTSKYPYTDFHTMNLDWLLAQMLQLRTDMKDFVNLNTIKYADPIQWNITTQYQGNTVVVEPVSGDAYISTQPVPAGVAVTDTDYWTIIGSFGTIFTDIKASIAAADEGPSTIASANRAVDDLVWLSDKLYVVTADIATGESYVSGTNCEPVTIEVLLKKEQESIELLNQNIVNINGSIANIAGSVVNIAGDLTAEITARTDADNIIHSSILTLAGEISELQGSDVYVAPEMYGAIGDGVADDTEAVNAAVEAAISEGKMLLLTNTYLSAAAAINAPIEICGGGTLKQFPFRYDTLNSQLNDTDRYFETSHPDYYHKNTVITIHAGDTYQVLIVDRVDGNKIYVEPEFYTNSTDTVRTFSSGAFVNIHKLSFYVAYTNTVANSDTQLGGVNIHDIRIIGNQSGYDSDYYHIMDNRYNGHIFCHSIKDSMFHSLYLDTANNISLCILGNCDRISVQDNIIKNIHHADTALDVSTETANAVTFHWSQRFINTDEVTIHATVSGNIIENCYDGIFLSAAQFVNVVNNKITDVAFRGIMLYKGDVAYDSRGHNVSNNTLINCAQGDITIGAIYNAGSTQSMINGNFIRECQNGIINGAGDDNLILNNSIIGSLEAGIVINSGYRTSIMNNYIDGAMKMSIYINVADVGNTYITICGNQHAGTRSTDAGIYVRQGKAVIIYGEMLMQTQIPYLVLLLTSQITLGDVLVFDSYVNTGVAKTADLAYLKYHNCIKSDFTIQSNLS